MDSPVNWRPLRQPAAFSRFNFLKTEKIILKKTNMALLPGFFKQILGPGLGARPLRRFVGADPRLAGRRACPRDPAPPRRKPWGLQGGPLKGRWFLTGAFEPTRCPDNSRDLETKSSHEHSTMLATVSPIARVCVCVSDFQGTGLKGHELTLCWRSSFFLI